MILVVSSQTDVHALAVMQELAQQKRTAELFDLSLFPQQLRLSMCYAAAGGHHFSIQRQDGTRLDLAECRSIWWRRPQAFVLAPDLKQPAYRNFALSESHEALTGLWQALNSFWVNPPLSDDAAHRKAYQLKIAQEVGLAIPHTLISNDPTAVNEFIASQGYERTIYKAFSATEQEWRETRIVRQEELHLIESVKYAPVIFQEYIPARYDLRITIVGDHIFPAAIYSQETAYPVDFRMDIANARIEAVTLPEQIQTRLHALMARLGLVYGAIDMRMTPHEEYVFLEINPAGQWLFVQERTQQPISERIAHILMSHDS